MKFTHTRRHLFLSWTPNFIRIPHSVYEIFNSFKLLSQISVTDTTYFVVDVIWLIHLPAGECPSPPCPWDNCATVSWDTWFHQPTGLATEQSTSQSGGLCDLGYSAGTSLPLPDPWRRPSERTSDWRVASFWSEQNIDRAVNQWRDWLPKCVPEKEGHFQHMIWTFWLFWLTSTALETCGYLWVLLF